MAQFYTLEEAARVLGMSPEELKAKAQHREVRAFLDGGSWRFRVADVDELARRRGLGSDAELRLSDLDLPAGRRRRRSDEIDLSEFQLGAAKPDLGQPTMDVPPASQRASGSRPRHPARRPLATAQPGHRLELGDHRHGTPAARCRATPTSGSCPTTPRGRAIPTSAAPGPRLEAPERLRRHPHRRRLPSQHDRPRVRARATRPCDRARCSGSSAEMPAGRASPTATSSSPRRA